VVRLITEALAGNPYVRVFRNAGDIIREHPTVRLTLQFGQAQTAHERTGNAPTGDEVAGIFIDRGEGPLRNVRIALQYHPEFSGTEHHIEVLSFLDPRFAPILYPLLFPGGDPWWSRNLRLLPRCDNGTGDQGSTDIGLEHTLGENDDDEEEETGPHRGQRLTMRAFAAYRLFMRAQDGVSLLLGGRALLQFLVDVFAGIEQNRLDWVRLSQTHVRAELYHGTYCFFFCFTFNCSLI
jgi:hypothetical protein